MFRRGQIAGLLAAASVCTSAQAPRIALTVETQTGAAQTVMDYRRDSCPGQNGLDLPDVQARAFRRPDGVLALVSGNAPVNFFMTGPSFDQLRRNCSPVLVSGDNHQGHTFDNQEWITSVYRVGDTVHALVHNEYHDPVASNCKPGITDPSNPCWYNAVTQAVSNDGGRTFQQAAAPNHVAAALPIPWSAVALRGAPPPYGYFSASNIVRRSDGFFYSMFMAIRSPSDSAQGTCLMRTNNLADPASWRAWDGTGFALPMRSPYTAQGAPAPTGLAACTFIDPRNLAALHGSLTFNTYLDSYIAVGAGAYSSGGATVCGSYFSLSVDLLNWTTPQLLLPGKLPYPPCNTGNTADGSLIYHSLIDHSDTSVNFENTARTPHLYYVRWNTGLDRDMLRVPVTFTARPGITSAASFQSGAVAPGEIVTLFGNFLGPSGGASGELSGGKLADSAGGTRVLFDGIAAPVVWAGPTQVSVVTPFGIAGRGQVPVVVERGAQRSNAAAVNVVAARPGIFTLTQNGLGQAAAVNHADGAVNSRGTPVGRGESLMVFFTGGGGRGVDGQIATGAAALGGDVTATVGGVAAAVTYAGAAPGLVAGALQANVTIPAAAPAGAAVPLTLRVNGIASQAGVTIAVR